MNEREKKLKEHKEWVRENINEIKIKNRALYIEEYQELLENGLLPPPKQQKKTKQEKDEIKLYLTKQPHKSNTFWFYDKSSCWNLSDWNLISYVLFKLDVEDINLLFEMYPKREIKEVWKKEMALQGNRIKAMNFFIATHYFQIKNPNRYYKRLYKEFEKEYT